MGKSDSKVDLHAAIHRDHHHNGLSQRALQRKYNVTWRTVRRALGPGGEHDRFAGRHVGEPAECRCARLGGVPASPRLWQEQVAELGLSGSLTNHVQPGGALVPQAEVPGFETRPCRKRDGASPAILPADRKARFHATCLPTMPLKFVG